MRLKKFQIQNYCSIRNSDVINLSENENVLVFAGQNESGKSSILRALYDFEREKFRPDSMPFSTGDKPIQTVSCTYRIEKDDNIANILSAIIASEGLVGKGCNMFDKNKIKNIQEFTITKTKSNENDEVELSIDEHSFMVFQSSVLKKPETKQEAAQETKNEIEEESEEAREWYNGISEKQNFEIAEWFWQATPHIVLFESFCDLLPDKIFISDLREKGEDFEGYKAVKNLEKILKTDFIKKDKETDAIRRVKEDEENEDLSINFQECWGQRIHGQNKVTVKYNFHQKDGQAENGSYINFYVETKKGQPLPPRQRSKGLIWFLSLWLELSAQNIEHNNLVLLLDEPDQHLHPKAQTDILALINKLSKGTDDKKGNQVFYATHSQYLIETNSLNRIKLVLNTEEGTKIENITTSKIDTANKQDALKPIVDAMGLNVSELSILNKKNVILEGISDYYYFTGMKKILEKTGDYAFVPWIGVRKIDNLTSLLIGYGLSWIAIIDDDPEEGGKDSRKKFNEISDFVFDGDADKTEKKVYILKKAAGIENIFTYDDLKLIHPDADIEKHNDKTKAVGRKRKVVFSKLFLEKANAGEITKDNISKKAKDNFEKAFKFIENSFAVSKNNS